SIYPRHFRHEETGVSSQVRTILEAITAKPRIGRKELADKLIVNLSAEETERVKMALASDLRWLVTEGYVIEFNDGSLDLPRAKAKPAVAAAVSTANESAEEVEAVLVLIIESNKKASVAVDGSTTEKEMEIGGSSRATSARTQSASELNRTGSSW